MSIFDHPDVRADKKAKKKERETLIKNKRIVLKNHFDTSVPITKNAKKKLISMLNTGQIKKYCDLDSKQIEILINDLNVRISKHNKRLSPSNIKKKNKKKKAQINMLSLRSKQFKKLRGEF